MSEIENVSKKILDDAARQKEEMLEAAEKKAQEILSEAEDKRSRIKSEAKKQASEKYDQVYQMVLSKNLAQMEQKVLLSKLGLIEGVIEKAKKRLKESDSKEYLTYIKGVLNSLDLPEGAYMIGKNEKGLKEEALRPLMDQANIKRSKDEPDFDEGVKIVSGNAQYSISFPDAIEAIKEDLKIELASFLFDEEK